MQINELPQRIPVHNNTAMPLYVGAQMVPPGETRHFPADQVPQHLLPQAEVPPAPAPADPIAELRKESVREIAAQLAALTDEELLALEAMELNDDPPRKTLLEAIAEERLERAGSQG